MPDQLQRNDPQGALDLARRLKKQGRLDKEAIRILLKYQDTFSEAFVDELDQILRGPNK